MDETVRKQYESAREVMLAETMRLFPPGSRVQPIGTTTGNWGATVQKIDDYHRRELAADHVFLDWDNGNRFAVNIAGIEMKK